MIEKNIEKSRKEMKENLLNNIDNIIDELTKHDIFSITQMLDYACDYSDGDLFYNSIKEMVYDYLGNVECDNDEQMKQFDELEKNDEKINNIVSSICSDEELKKETTKDIEWYINKEINEIIKEE